MSKNPNMTPRQALLLTADFLESHPSAFQFLSFTQPRSADCGTPGCALGWLACIAGLRPNDQYFDPKAIGEFMGIGYQNFDFIFYSRMDHFDDKWEVNAERCARAMRRFADAYYPATEVTR